MTVGILIPTYNRLRFLKDAVASALGQSHDDIEVIVIDNGSRDGSDAFVRGLADPRIRFVANPENLGLAGSVNRGVGMFGAGVKWCTVLCDDDLLEKNFVRESLKAISRFSPRAVVDSRRVFVDVHDRPLRSARRAPAVVSAFDYIRSRSRFLRETYLTGIMFRRDAFDAVGGYPAFGTGAGTDDAFIFSLSLRDKLYCADGARAFIRIHEGAESMKPSGYLRHMQGVRDLCRHIMAESRRPGLLKPREVERLDGLVEHYARSMDDHYWSLGIREAKREKPAAGKARYEELVGMAKKGEFRFSARTRMSACILERTGWFPESFFLYRVFWRSVKLLKILSL